MDIKKRQKRLPHYLSESEINKLFSVLKYSTRDSIIIKMLYYFALRINELLTLKVSNISYTKREIKVVGKGNKEGSIPVLVDTEDFFNNELKEYIAKNNLKDLLIVGNSKNGQLSKRHCLRILKKYSLLANLENISKIHPHTLRHSRATFLYNKTGNLSLVQEFLRHSRIQTTEIYKHTGTEFLRERINEKLKL